MCVCVKEEAGGGGGGRKERRKERCSTKNKTSHANVGKKTKKLKKWHPLLKSRLPSGGRGMVSVAEWPWGLAYPVQCAAMRWSLRIRRGETIDTHRCHFVQFIAERWLSGIEAFLKTLAKNLAMRCCCSVLGCGAFCATELIRYQTNTSGLSAARLLYTMVCVPH